MGQGYLIVNKTKKEYITPHCLGSGYKFLEFVPDGGVPRVLAFLLWRSDSRGGGDGNVDNRNVKDWVGRWAGDEVYVIGDYDSSNLYGEARDRYNNVSEPVRKSFNAWMDWDDAKLPPRFSSLTSQDCSPSKGAVLSKKGRASCEPRDATRAEMVARKIEKKPKYREV